MRSTPPQSCPPRRATLRLRRLHLLRMSECLLWSCKRLHILCARCAAPVGLGCLHSSFIALRFPGCFPGARLGSALSAVRVLLPVGRFGVSRRVGLELDHLVRFRFLRGSLRRILSGALLQEGFRRGVAALRRTTCGEFLSVWAVQARVAGGASVALHSVFRFIAFPRCSGALVGLLRRTTRRRFSFFAGG